MATRHDENSENSEKKKYKIKIESGGNILTYDATELLFNGAFVSFKDRFGKKVMVNVDKVISVEEVGDD